MLQIRLLGQFDVRIDGKRVMIPTRAGQSLFAYLVLTAGIPHRREKLAGTFWPNTTEEAARKNLRQELWRIRKAISTQQTTEEEYLLADEFTLKFNREAQYWLDVAQMERPDLDLQSLIANLSLYQGELLPGFYDEWIALERERIQSVFDARAEQLLEQLITAERWIAVQEWGERWLALGVREPAYRALMLASNARGDIAKVASLYQRCTKELLEYLGVEPSAETRLLYEGLLKGTKTASRFSPAQPSGTITFLFTDIEGSTRLLDKMGHYYATALTEHHEIMRTAIQKWNGREMDTQGDAFFVTFARALDAVQFAAEAQRALLSHAWPQGESLRVRMGLHTGEPLIASTGYVGMDVHRAARIGDAGHGGQILLSHTTRELVAHDLPQGMSIRDLGEHRLKDMKYPTSIYQLVVEGLPADFAPLRTKFSGAEMPTPGDPPFKGLQFFDVDDSNLFFGREVLTAKLVERLCEENFLSVIIGASGSGKSSLVRAGVVPAMRSGILINGTKLSEDGTPWKIHIITPTAHPLEALAVELTRESESVTAAATLVDDLSKDPRSLHFFLTRQARAHDLAAPSQSLLVIDQFEELFTLCRDDFEREAFIDNLLTALTPASLPLGEERKGEGNMTLVITLRADFYAHLAQYPQLRDAVAQHQEYIGPMTTEELRRAIEEPARRGHWEFEPGLVDLILRDVGDEPGALPLLSHALLETWKRRAGHVLTLKGYADAGGVLGAIAHTAESVYQNLSADEQTIMRNILLRLTEFGEGTEDTRRRASFNELMSSAADVAEVRAVLNKLADARLVTLSANMAEVAHEALIREWPQLREWLSQDREGIILHRHLTEAAQEWELLERDADILYRGARLAQAREWAAMHPTALNVLEQAFLDASNVSEQNEIKAREAQQQRELEAARKLAATEKQSVIRLRGRNRIITVVGVIALVLAILAGAFGFSSNQNAQQAEHNSVLADQQRVAAQNAQATAQAIGDLASKAAAISFSRELAAQAQLNLTIDPERSILLSLAGLGKADTLEAENALHAAISTSRLRMTLRGQKGITSVTYSPDGKLLASTGSDGTARLWDAASGKQLLNLQHPSPVKLVLFTPDGTRLITATDDGSARIWDVTSGKQLLSFTITNPMSPGYFFFSMATSPDGKLLATTAADDGTVKLWDTASGTEMFRLESPEWSANGSGVDLKPDGLAFSPEGHLAISLVAFEGGPGHIEIWDAAAQQKLQTLDLENNPYSPPAFSPDGTRIASRDGTQGDVWDVASGKLLFTFSRDRTINSVQFSRDGQRLIVAGGGGVAGVFDAETGNKLLSMPTGVGRIPIVAESPDCVEPPVAPFEWCGTRLAAAVEDDTIRIWDISPNGEKEALTVPGDDFALDFNSMHLNTITYDIFPSEAGGTVTIERRNLLPGVGTDPASGYASTSFQLDKGYRDRAFFARDGILAALFDSGPIRLWDVTEGGKPIYPISCCTWTQDMYLTFSSRLHPRLAIAHMETGSVILWDLAIDKQIQILQLVQPDDPPSHGLLSMLLNPDGEHLAVERNDGTVEIWDATSGQKLLELPDFVTAGGGASNPETDFSPDGKLLVVTNCSGTQVVLDAATGKEVSRFHRRGCTIGIAISADNKYIALRGPESKIYNLETGQEVLTLPIRSGSVLFTQDGSRLIASVGGGPLFDPTVNVYLLRLNDLIALAKTRVTRSLTTAECQQYLHVDQCPAGN